MALVLSNEQRVAITAEEPTTKLQIALITGGVILGGGLLSAIVAISIIFTDNRIIINNASESNNNITNCNVSLKNADQALPIKLICDWGPISGKHYVHFVKYSNTSVANYKEFGTKLLSAVSELWNFVHTNATNQSFCTEDNNPFLYMCKDYNFTTNCNKLYMYYTIISSHFIENITFGFNEFGQYSYVLNNIDNMYVFGSNASTLPISFKNTDYCKNCINTDDSLLSVLVGILINNTMLCDGSE